MTNTRRNFLWSLTASLVAGTVESAFGDSSSRQLTIAAAPRGGAMYALGTGLAKVFEDVLRIRTHVKETGGPVHNIAMVEARQVDLGIVTAGPLFESWHGLAWANGQKHRNLRSVLTTHTTYFQLYTLARTGIRTLYDLQGRRVGVGPAGGTPGTYWPLIFDVTGVRPAELVHGTHEELHARLRQGTLDAIARAGGIPIPIIAEGERDGEVVVLGVPREAAGEFVIKYPYFSHGIIPTGVYLSVREPQPTLTLRNFVVAHKDADEALINRLLKTIFDHLPILVKIHSSANELQLDNVRYSLIPLHRGAVRYYRDRGVDLPPTLTAGA